MEAIRSFGSFTVISRCRCLCSFHSAVSFYAWRSVGRFLGRWLSIHINCLFTLSVSFYLSLSVFLYPKFYPMHNTLVVFEYISGVSIHSTRALFERNECRNTNNRQAQRGQSGKSALYIHKTASAWMQGENKRERVMNTRGLFIECLHCCDKFELWIVTCARLNL